MAHYNELGKLIIIFLGSGCTGQQAIEKRRLHIAGYREASPQKSTASDLKLKTYHQLPLLISLMPDTFIQLMHQVGC